MHPHAVPQLLHRLNAFCTGQLDAAASFAITRTHYEVTCEHLLIKLLERGDGDLPLILHRFGVPADDFWHGLLATLERFRAGSGGKPALSPDLAGLLDRAWSFASLELNHTAIRSGHLLAALTELPQVSLPAGMEGLLRISRDVLRQEFEAITRHSVEVEGAEGAGVPIPGDMQAGNVGAPGSKVGAVSQALAQFTEDLTEKARRNAIDPVYGRDQEIRQMIDILCRRRKNNPILVGDPGVGKTALVEGLARAIIAGEVPEELRQVRLLTLDLGLLQAGAGVKGEFENRLKNVIRDVNASPTPIILFIDEAHTLIGAGNSAGQGDAANLLKPALARGELRTIAATTWSEYKQYFERDAALERRFQLLKVAEPDEERACLMLRGLKEKYETHHGIRITDEAVRAAVRLSSRYITGRQLPDKAVDLLDTAATRVRMGWAVKPPLLVETDAQIASKELEQAAAQRDWKIAQSTGEAARATQVARDAALIELRATSAALHDRWQQELAIVQRIREQSDGLLNGATSSAARQAVTELRAQLALLQGDEPMLQAEVQPATVAQVVAEWTGVPAGRMQADEAQTLLSLERHLQQRVKGQDAALAALANAVRAAKAGLRNPEAPLGVFLLAGPSGVGKTETARALAEALFGGERHVITINMSEYQEAHTVSQLKGSPPGYVGYGEGGILTEAVRQRPYSVVLLDEVEKAHRDVLNLFYQVFDRGFMRDGEGREIDFKNTAILMTSNLGADETLTLCGQYEGVTAEHVLEAIRGKLVDHFQAALLARMQVVPYMPLDAQALEAIVRAKLGRLEKRLADSYQIALLYSSTLVEVLSKSASHPDAGARNLDSLIDRQLLPEIARTLLSRLGAPDMPRAISLIAGHDGQVQIDFHGSDDAARAMLEKGMAAPSAAGEGVAADVAGTATGSDA